ncbi:MAG TPA: chemotaxis protein CheW [Anaeromyxobacteraceae bacterium]|nr:chemotaxis protein CheW [Anaeromyxobacteraceae bacterium]
MASEAPAGGTEFAAGDLAVGGHPDHSHRGGFHGPSGTRDERGGHEGWPFAPATSLAGKHLTFKLAEEAYGLEILEVREIIGLMDLTRMPRTEPTDETAIIVAQYELAGRRLAMGIPRR